MTISVIISTYNNPLYLGLTLQGYSLQSLPPNEIIIADDGSSTDTAQLISLYDNILPIRHIWQPHHGFQKSRILNLAIANASSDYLIFSDQDCIPHPNLVLTHALQALPRHFISAGCLRLTSNASQRISPADISSQRIFNPHWLTSIGMPLSIKLARLLHNNTLQHALNTLSPARPTFNGCNSSAWRNDIIAVNGFDERMRYGGQDRELGIRLLNNHIQPLQRRYSAITIHLDHPRPYRTQQSLNFNNSIIRQSRSVNATRTPYGLTQVIL